MPARADSSAEGTRHRAGGVVPMPARGLGDERIARGRVHRLVEAHVGLDHASDASGGESPAPRRDQ
jgi:hypothetical protein